MLKTPHLFQIEDIMPVIISVIIDDNSVCGVFLFSCLLLQKILFRHDGPTTLGEQLDFKLDLDLPAGDKKTLKFSFLSAIVASFASFIVVSHLVQCQGPALHIR